MIFAKLLLVKLKVIIKKLCTTSWHNCISYMFKFAKYILNKNLFLSHKYKK